MEIVAECSDIYGVLQCQAQVRIYLRENPCSCMCSHDHLCKATTSHPERCWLLGSCTDCLAFAIQVPEHYVLQQPPVQLHGEVASGFGRGSKQLGFPTANLPPGPLQKELEGLPKGVYFG